MEKTEFGNSGIIVSKLGYGAGQIGDGNISEGHCEYLLNSIVDLGINLIDTARGYGLSEDRIGKYLSNKRDKIVISTKVGYGIEGYYDWTYDCIIAGIEEALKKMRTDYIDIVHLHSCSIDILKRGEVIEALLKAKQDGKIRLAGYSGENNELDFAVESGLFGAVECSVNICDQKSISNQILKAKQRGIGVIAKRSIANAPWKYNDQPHGNYCEEYWKRMKQMGIPDYGIDMAELFIRFTAFSEGISSAISGSTNMEHINKNIEFIKRGALSEEIVRDITRRFIENGENWYGQV